MNSKTKLFLVIAGAIVVALPLFLRRDRFAYESCYAKLRQIDGAKETWRMDNHKTTNDIPTWEVLREYFRTVTLQCPNGGAYTIGRVGELPTCSIPADAAYWEEHMKGS